MKEIVFVESNGSGHGLRAIGVAKKLGLNVRFLAANPSFFCNDGHDPLAIADQVIVTDTYDVDGMMQVIDSEKTAGVVAWDDYHLVPAAEIAQKLGLPHAAIEGINNCRFKDRTRTRLRELGEQRPNFAVVSEERVPAESPIGYPCVVKPVDDSGSVGVKICKNQTDFETAMNVLQGRTKNVRGYELSRRWLIEEFVEGPEFSAELLYVKGEWHMLGVTKKLLNPPPYFVEVGHLFPVSLPEAIYKSVKSKVFSWIEALGLNSGAAHVEFRLTDEGPVLMEVNPRLGGDMIPTLIETVYGFDVVEYLLKESIGEESDLNVDFKPKRAAAIQFLVADQQGTILEIQGVDQVNAMPFTVDVQVKSGPIEVQAATSSYDRFGHVIVSGATMEETEANITAAFQELKAVWGVTA